MAGEAEEADQIEEREEEFLTADKTVGKKVEALLDTGCLVGDCISQEIVNSLDASRLLLM
jgi:hypothetical protein